jgi:ABC-type dipeptide/oligopeptide/nickel transport system permease subunit
MKLACKLEDNLMTAAAPGAKPIILGKETEKVKVRTPLGDAWSQFKRNRLAVVALGFIIFLIFLALSADILRTVGILDDPNFQHAGNVQEGVLMSKMQPLTCSTDARRQSPQWCFMFGTDYQRRDLASRLIYGLRVSLLVGLVGAATAMTLGILYGVIAGYRGGRTDNYMMRFVDFMYAFPDLALIIVMQSYFSAWRNVEEGVPPIIKLFLDIDAALGGLFFVFIVIGALSWIGVARLARGQVLSVKKREYVEAARSIGARNNRIIFTHILPNIMGPLVVVAVSAIPGFMLAEATLSYLGIGINPPTASWGDMLNEAITNQSYLAPIEHFLLLGPGLAFTLTLLSFNFLADGLRDALDPSLRGS